jgi:hypothetical protein
VRFSLDRRIMRPCRTRPLMRLTRMSPMSA